MMLCLRHLITFLVLIQVTWSLEIWNNKIKLTEPCMTIADNLKKLAASFISCASDNSRPFSICKSCIGSYLKFREAYEIMRKVTLKIKETGWHNIFLSFTLKDENLYATTLFPEGLTCKDIVEAGDSVQPSYHIFNTINTIWDNSNCESCFQSYELVNGTAKYTLDKDVINFFNIYQKLFFCIYNYTGVTT